MYCRHLLIRRIRFALFVLSDPGSDVAVHKECIGKQPNTGSRGKFSCNWSKAPNRKFFFDTNFNITGNLKSDMSLVFTGMQLIKL